MPPAALPSKDWIKGLPHTPHVSDDCSKRISPILPMSEPFQTNNIRGLKPNPSAVSYKQNHSLTALSLDLLEKAFLGRKTNALFSKCTLAYPCFKSIQFNNLPSSPQAARGQEHANCLNFRLNRNDQRSSEINKSTLDVGVNIRSRREQVKTKIRPKDR